MSLVVPALAAPGTALFASVTLLWRARRMGAVTSSERGFWLLAAVGAAASAAHTAAGHLLLALAVAFLVAARVRGTDWMTGIDAAGVAVGATVAALMIGPEGATAVRLELIGTLALVAAVATLAAGPGERGIALWALLSGLVLLTAGDVASTLGAGTSTLQQATAIAGHIALAATALQPAAERLTRRGEASSRHLRVRSLIPLALAMGVVPYAYVVAEIRHGGVDAPVYALTAAFVGVLVVIRTALLTRARNEEHAAHQRSARRFRALVEHGSDITCVVDDAGEITYTSPAVLTMLGHRSEQVVGTAWRDAVHLSDLRSLQETCADVRRSTGRSGRTEIRVRERGGAWRWVELTITNRLRDPAVHGLVCNLRDINEHKQAQQELQTQALHDTLTGLPNRALLLQRLQTALDRGRKDSVAVAFLDLDHFKEINDSLGHEIGDVLLKTVAQRIRDAVRPGDVVARFGGDEFVVVCEQLTSRNDAVAIMERLIDRMRVPIDAGGHELHVTPSVGIAFATGEDSPDTLIRDADAAMYRAKAEGRARHAVFDRSMRDQALRRLETGTGLHAALKREEFRVFYQPIVHVGSGAIAGVEALVRWQHPLQGLLPPRDFIDLAEEHGLTSAIGAVVLSVAAEDMQRWEGRQGRTALEVAVNVSARQLRSASFVQDVKRALTTVGLDPERLCLEITENVLLEYADTVAVTLGHLKELGVRIGIDDFGAGYTSLQYLKRFPVDVLKIDQSFISGVCDSSQDAAIVSAIIDLAHTFQTTTVAEGVETPAQLARLAEMGCDMAQGYLFARPQPAYAIGELLSARIESVEVPDDLDSRRRPTSDASRPPTPPDHRHR